MIDYDILKRQISRHEGRRPKMYRDSKGIWTIGIGRNLERGLSDDEIDYLFDNDIEHVEAILEAQDYWHDLNEARQRVLMDMVFNLGWNRFSGFKRMIAAIRRREYKGASREMLDSLWHKQVGIRSERLAEIMETGIDKYFI